MTATQQTALEILRAEHVRTLARAETWTVVPQGIRPATVYALQRLGAVTVKTAVDTDSRLIKGAFGRWLGGSKSYTYATMFVQVTR